jgi:nitrate reductase beta subunit
MMRPVTFLKKNPDIEIAHQNNLRSALAYAAILTKNGSSDIDFYRNIVAIPHYQTYSTLFRLFDYESTEEIVKNQLSEFREIYEPLAIDNFKDSFVLSNGKFEKDNSSA